MNDKTSILFVCMGNICRSPAAEGFFRHHITAAQKDHLVHIDSAGTHGYHIGHAPDPRAIRATSAYGIDLGALRARQLSEQDFHRFDLIIGMDEQNYLALNQLNQAAGARARVLRMMEFSSRFDTIADVPDPYYGEQEDFDYMCELLDESCKGLLQRLEQFKGRID